ncbi:MAG: DUF4145 domain-containing protein [Bacteroidales bacterium]
MDVTKWLKSTFSQERIPEWQCPNCKSGKLILVNEKFHFEETAQSLSYHDQDEWEPEFICYIFCGLLTCPNCGEHISFLGKGNVEHDQYYDQFRDEYHEEYNNIFEPSWFNPPLELFRINTECPKEIKNEIIESFSLFWSDLPSCANKIRTSIEMLMNQQKVKTTIIQSGKRRLLSLHRRIEEFKAVNSEIADYLLAIKWIGNIGSHPGKLEKIDILETYELLEFSLDKLFDNKETKMKKLSKEIIKRKGVRKRKKI